MPGLKTSFTSSHFAIISALFLSCVSAYFSVAGMSILFSGASTAAIVMASALEFSKVVSAAWLQYNWNTCSKIIRTYLVVATGILILLTSMGTFGYLSRAHLATADNVNRSELQIQPLEYQLQLEERKLKNAQTALDTLDKQVNSLDVKNSVSIRSHQKVERENLNLEIQSASTNLENINAKLLPLKTKQATETSEVGPLKYIAEVIYGKDAPQHFDEAVRFVIFSIVIVFDPLAIILLLAGTAGVKTQSVISEKRTRSTKKNKMISIPENSIMRFLNDEV